MGDSVHSRIKHLLEGTHEAFQSTGAVNSDYAGFAAMAIHDFQSALQNPALTARDLRLMIRAAHQSHFADNPAGCWASFVATHVERSANAAHAPQGETLAKQAL